MSESTPEDRIEQQSSAAGDAELPETPDVPLEAPDADVVEQAAPTGPEEHLAGSAAEAGDLPAEADSADAAEQAVVVELDEDERR